MSDILVVFLILIESEFLCRDEEKEMFGKRKRRETDMEDEQSQSVLSNGWAENVISPNVNWISNATNSFLFGHIPIQFISNQRKENEDQMEWKPLNGLQGSTA